MSNCENYYQNQVEKIANQLDCLAKSNELEEFSEYFDMDNIYDVEYRINKVGEYISSEIMIHKNPDIYIKTYSSEVIMYHDIKEFKSNISLNTSSKIDEIFEENYLYTRTKHLY